MAGSGVNQPRSPGWGMQTQLLLSAASQSRSTVAGSWSQEPTKATGSRYCNVDYSYLNYKTKHLLLKFFCKQINLFFLFDRASWQGVGWVLKERQRSSICSSIPPNGYKIQVWIRLHPEAWNIILVPWLEHCGLTALKPTSLSWDATGPKLPSCSLSFHPFESSTLLKH